MRIHAYNLAISEFGLRLDKLFEEHARTYRKVFIYFNLLTQTKDKIKTGKKVNEKPKPHKCENVDDEDVEMNDLRTSSFGLN